MIKKYLLSLIILLAAVSRFVGLDALPPALNRDEAAIGYNAYSILKTAKDEHGQVIPISFKSIGDYKSPLYIYATVIPVQVFGLNDFSIRFWAAVSGVVSVIAIYYLSLEFFKNQSMALLSAFLLALNPWAIFYSRIGFEANLALALFLVSFCLLKRGLKKLSYFIFGLITTILALFTYSSSIVFVPLVLAVFIFLNRKKLSKNHWLFLTFFATIVSIIVIVLMPISSQKSSITVFSDPATIDFYNRTRSSIQSTNPLLARTWWNKYVFFTREIANNYLKTFSPNFLLLKGGNHPWHQIPNMGYFYYLEIIFAALGGYYLLKKSNQKSIKLTLIAWFLLAPLASAITIDAPHATRSLHLLPIIIILASFGFYQLRPGKKFFSLITILYLINVGYFAKQYIIQYPKQIRQSLPVDLKQAIKKTKDLEGPIYLYNIHDSTYLYPLVYNQFDPTTFQTQAVWTKPDTAGLINAYQFGQFTIVDDQKDIINPQAVIKPHESGDFSVQIY